MKILVKQKIKILKKKMQNKKKNQRKNKKKNRKYQKCLANYKILAYNQKINFWN